jgi:hypothetical protein
MRSAASLDPDSTSDVGLPAQAIGLGRCPNPGGYYCAAAVWMNSATADALSRRLSSDFS